MVNRALTQELSAQVEADFRPTGLRCLIRIPVNEVIAREAGEHPPEADQH